MDKNTYALKKNLSHSQANEELQKIKKACQEFETVFTFFLLKNMRQTIPGRHNAVNYTVR